MVEMTDTQGARREATKSDNACLWNGNTGASSLLPAADKSATEN
jgi:hypothetical protein